MGGCGGGMLGAREGSWANKEQAVPSLDHVKQSISLLQPEDSVGENG